MVQLYVHDGHSKIDRPAHELKGFKRVELKPGESQTVASRSAARPSPTGARRRRHGSPIPAPSRFRSAHRHATSASAPHSCSNRKNPLHSTLKFSNRDEVLKWRAIEVLQPR